MTGSSSKPLAGSVAVVTGGLGDIGRAIAFQLRNAGATVALSDLLPARRARQLMAGFHYCRVDVTSAASIKRWLSQVEKDVGLPTIVISNAAIILPGDSSCVRPMDWQRTLGVNLTGAFYVAQRVVKRLREKRKPGRIVFVGSWAAHIPNPHITAYCVAKAGLRMAMKCLALEVAPFAITVNEFAPGYVDAGLSARLFARQPGLRTRAQGNVPTAKLLTANDVARGVLELCQPADIHRTGSVVLHDGGLSLVSVHEEHS